MTTAVFSRSVSEIQVSLTACYAAIEQLVAGNRLNSFSFASSQTHRSYAYQPVTRETLESYRIDLLEELAVANQIENPDERMKFRQSFVQLQYNKFAKGK